MKIAARAIILHEGKVLLVQHKGRDFYSLPGGKVDEGEDIQSALVREMEEELAVQAKIEKMLFVHEFQYPGGDMSLEFFFLVQNGADFLGDNKGEYAEIELADIAWKNVDEELNIMPKFLQEKLKTLSNTSLLEFYSEFSVS
jgi:8-oxo-dGTP pyrophosphatase MutT (NUDIX family)